MATNNSQNSQYTNNADGYTLGGGTTVRSLTLTGGNVTVTGAGSNTYTMPAASDTLVGRASSDTLTNKTIDGSQLVNASVTAAKIEAQQAWQTPTLTNSWANFGGAYNTAGYFKDSLGIVHLKGLVKSGTVSSTGSIFTLPAGSRPLARTYISVGSNAAIGICEIATDGTVNATVGSNAAYSIDNITFRADN